MGGSILDRAYEDERNAALDQELDALLNDPAYGTPKPEAPAAAPAASEPADLWSDGPDRKERIRKASEEYISKWAAGEGGPEMANKPVDFERVKKTGERLGKVFESLGPAYDKLGTDMEAFFIENPAGIPGGNPVDAEDETYSAMVGAFGPYIQGLIQEPFNPAGAIDRVSKEQVTKDERLAKANRNSALKAAMINARMPVGDSDIEQGLYDATFSLGQTLPALVAGIATKNPYLAASLMGGQTTMGSYGDARRAGADKGKAWRYGLGMGTIEAATEFLPAKFFIGDVAARTGFVETFLKQAAADGVGEQAATVGQSLLTWAELNPDKPFSEFVAGLPEEMKRTFYASIWQSSIMSGAQQGLAQIGKPKEEGGTEDPEGTPPAAEPEAAAPEAAPERQDTQAAPDEAGQDGEPDNAFLKSVDAIVGAVQAAEQKQEQQVTEPRVDPEAAFLDDVNRLFGMPASPVPVAAENGTLGEEAAPAVDITVLRDEAQATLDRALETESSEDISAAVSAYNALMEKTGGAQIDPENPLPENPTPEEREAFVAQVEQAIEEAPPTPAEEAISKVVDEVRAEAPASRYFGRKVFGGAGLAQEAPAQAAEPVAEAAPEQRPQPILRRPATTPATTPAISEAELARIGEQETARSRAVTRREDMAEKAETVYDDILTKPVLELLNDEFNMSERQVREIMGKAIDGLGAIDRFNTIMKRYAKVKARLEREAAQQPQVQEDFAALVEQQPDPGEGGLGRGMQSLMDDQAGAPILGANRFTEGQTWNSMWGRVRRFAGRPDAARRLDDAIDDAAMMLAGMTERQAAEVLSDARQLGSPDEKTAADEVARRLKNMRENNGVMFSRNDDIYSDVENYNEEIQYAMQDLLPTVQRLEVAVAPITSGNQPNQAIVEPLTQVKEMLNRSLFAPEELPTAGVELNAKIEADLQAIVAAIEDAVEESGGVPDSLRGIYEAEVAERLQSDIVFFERMLAEAKANNEAERVARLTKVVEEAPARVAQETLDRLDGQFNASDPIENYGLVQSPEDYSGLLEDWVPKARALGLNDVADRLEAITVDQIKDAVSYPIDSGTDLVQVAAKVRRNIDELADEIFNQARAAEDTSTPEWTEILDSLRDMLETNEAEGGLRSFSRPRNILFSRSDAKTRMENAEKNRKKLDYAAWLRWGEAYLEMVRTGDLSFASADDLISMGLPGDIKAVTIPGEGGARPETIINTSVARPHQMDGLILHEIGVHRGLQGLMGNGADQVFARLESILTSAADKQQQGLRLSSTEMDVIAARQQAIRNAARPEHVVEETLAYLVENYVYNPLVPDLITNMKVWIGRRFPGVIDRLGWGSKEFRQLAFVSTRKFIETIIYKPSLGLKGGRSRRAPLELDIRYPQDFQKRARGMGVKGLWRMVRDLDLRDVNNFAQNVANIEDELTSPEVIRALFDVVPNFDFPAYQDQITATKAGDPDAAFDLTETLARLKGMQLPVDVRFSAGGGRLRSAAVRIDGKTYTGRNHDEAAQAARDDGKVVPEINESAGFVDESGRFHRRNSEEAVYAALASGQIADPARRRVIESRLRSGQTVDLTSDMIDFDGVMFSRNTQPEAPRPEDGVPDSVREIYFNWMRFGGPENTWNSVRESLKDAAVSDRMGPAITHEQVAIDAEHANAFNAFLKSRNKDALSLEEITALRYLHKYASLKVWELAQLAEANPSDKKAEVAFMRASNFLTMVTAEVKGQSAQASRALSIWRIQARSTAAISAAVDQMVNDPNQTKTLRKMIGDVAKLNAKDFGKLNKRVEMSSWKAWQELAGTWVRAMFLSHFPTHVVNAMGNLMVMQGSVADHFMGGLITADMDLIEEAQVRQAAILEGFLHQFEYMKANSQLNPLKANPSLAFDPGEVPTDNKFVEGSRDRALSAARLEKLSFGLLKGADEKSGIGHLAEVLGYGLAAPSDALGVADDLFKGTNFRVSLRGQAFRKAREERRAGQITEAEEAERAEYLFQNPSPEMIKQGIADAQENTFTRPVGNMTRGALSVRNWLNEKTGIAGWLLLPFVITPSNILSFRFRRMPTAPFFKEWRDAYMRGGKDRAVAIAQVANGTSLMALGGALYAMGALTGLGPDDPQKRQALMATGWQPLAMKINGQYVNTNRLDPTMMPLHLSAAMAEIMANKSWMADGDEQFMELAMQSSVKFGQMMLDKSYLQGLSDVVTAFTSEGNAGQRLGLWWENAVAGATTPAALAAVRRAEDPWRRLAWDQLDRIRNRVPLLSSGLPEDYDDFGRPRGYQSGFGAVYDYASPFAASKIANEPIDQELMRLKYVPSRLSVNVSVPFAGNSIMVNLRAHDRADIYSDMLRLMGGDAELGIPNYRAMLNQLVESDGYKQLGDYNDPNIEGGKAKAIADLHSEFRSQIREVIVGDLYYSELQKLAAKELQAKNGLAAMREAEAQQSEITEMYEALTEEALQP